MNTYALLELSKNDKKGIFEIYGNFITEENGKTKNVKPIIGVECDFIEYSYRTKILYCYNNDTKNCTEVWIGLYDEIDNYTDIDLADYND